MTSTSTNNTPATAQVVPAQEKPANVVSGIINTITAEISDVITSNKGKTALRLKARDELDVLHGKGTFIAFEFSTMGGRGNMDYIQGIMKRKGSSLPKEIYLWQARYNLEQTEAALVRAKAELATGNEASDDCLAIFSEADAAKREFIKEALSDTLQELEDDVETLERDVPKMKTKVKQLEADCEKQSTTEK